MDLDIIQVLFSAAFSFGIVYLTIPYLIQVAYKKGQFQRVEKEREQHVRYVPTSGGIALFIALITGFSISGISSEIAGYSYFLVALTALFYLGLRDDVKGLSPFKKLVVEIVAGTILIFGSGIAITNFQGIFGIYELPVAISYLVTLFTMIVVVNAYNLIDGVDGLAGGIGVIASLFFGFGFFVAGQAAMGIMSTILAITLVGFLIYNFKPAKIFMGDTGSLIVGFLLSIFAIQFVNLNNYPAYTDIFSFSSPVMPVAILVLPLYDTIRVFYSRIRRKVSPFTPGQDHIHHELLRIGFGHKGTTLMLYGCSLFITLLAVTFSFLDVHALLAIILLATILVLPTNGTKRRILSRFGIDTQFNTSSLDHFVNDMKNDEADLDSSSKNKKGQPSKANEGQAV